MTGHKPSDEVTKSQAALMRLVQLSFWCGIMYPVKVEEGSKEQAVIANIANMRRQATLFSRGRESVKSILKPSARPSP